MTGNGIANLPVQKPSLEVRIMRALVALSRDNELKTRYTDSDDCARVLDRMRISAILNAIYEHGCSGIEELEFVMGPSPLDALAEVRRSFSHDAQRLDNGKKAKLVLAPVDRSAITPEQTIDAKRESLLRWLVLTELWKKERDTDFPTQKAVLKEAAVALVATSDSLKTQFSYIRRASAEYKQNNRPGNVASQTTTRYADRFNAAEVEYFVELEQDCRNFAVQLGGDSTPFALLLPGLRALKGCPI